MRSPGAHLRTLLVTALVVAELATPATAAGEAGALDPTFGRGGRVVGGFDGRASAVALQPDGKIVVAGAVDWKPGYPGLGVVRYNPDGTLDRSFGRKHNGMAVTGIFGRSAEPAALVVQPDGKIVVGGRSPGEGEGSTAFALARFNADGTLDRSFGRKGIVATDFFGGEQAIRDLVLQPDGRIVAGGFASPATRLVYRFALARYLPDGTLDPSFGTGGKVTTELGPGSSLVSALVLQPDGKVVAGGGTRGKLALVRYLPDGTLDPSFGTAGAVLTEFGRYGSLSDLVVLPSGTLVAAGAFTPHGGGNAQMLALVGYRPDGTLDPGFGSGGKVITDLPGKQEGVTGLAAQPDGKIVAVGGVLRTAQRPSALVLVARYQEDGDLDAGFGTGGVVTTAFRGESGAADVALQPNGRIVVVGTSVSLRLNEAGYPIWSYFVTARYLAA